MRIKMAMLVSRSLGDTEVKLMTCKHTQRTYPYHAIPSSFYRHMVQAAIFASASTQSWKLLHESVLNLTFSNWAMKVKVIFGNFFFKSYFIDCFETLKQTCCAVWEAREINSSSR